MTSVGLLLSLLYVDMGERKGGIAVIGDGMGGRGEHEGCLGV